MTLEWEQVGRSQRLKIFCFWIPLSNERCEQAFSRFVGFAHSNWVNELCDWISEKQVRMKTIRDEFIERNISVSLVCCIP